MFFTVLVNWFLVCGVTGLALGKVWTCWRRMNKYEVLVIKKRSLVTTADVVAGLYAYEPTQRCIVIHKTVAEKVTGLY